MNEMFISLLKETRSSKFHICFKGRATLRPGIRFPLDASCLAGSTSFATSKESKYRDIIHLDDDISVEHGYSVWQAFKSAQVATKGEIDVESVCVQIQSRA